MKNAFTLIELPAVRQRGFTLIELLVVVTIIVVLLALLTPALDKAIYQAELTVCAARLDGIGVAAQSYAFDYRRAYPRRESVYYPPFQFQSAQDGPPHDFRVPFRGYIDLNKSFNDPLNEDVDFEDDSGVNLQIFSDYSLWFGYQYKGKRGMLKVGDHLEYQDSRFNVMASDLDFLGNDGRELARAGHPDEQGKLASLRYQNELVVYNAITVSWWDVYDTRERGPVDNNYLLGDGSVNRLNRVLWNDPRTTALDAYADYRFPALLLFLPKN